jgi:hypothetical protein
MLIQSRSLLGVLDLDIQPLLENISYRYESGQIHRYAQARNLPIGMRFPINVFQIHLLAGCPGAWMLGDPWLPPVILAALEAEIRRIAVGSQPRQIVCKTLS